MGMFIFGFLLIICAIIAGVFIVVDFVRKRPLKNMVICALLLFVVGAIFASCGLASDIDSTNTNTKDTAIIEETSAPSDNEMEVEETSVSSNIKTTTEDDILYTQIYLEETAKNSGFSYVKVNGSTTLFTIELAQDGLADAIILYKISGYDEISSGWQTNVVDPIILLCDGASSYIQYSLGSDIPVEIHVLNDKNLDNILLAIYDGEVVYDAMEDN